MHRLPCSSFRCPTRCHPRRHRLCLARARLAAVSVVCWIRHLAVVGLRLQEVADPQPCVCGRAQQLQRPAARRAGHASTRPTHLFGRVDYFHQIQVVVYDLRHISRLRRNSQHEIEELKSARGHGAEQTKGYAPKFELSILRHVARRVLPRACDALARLRGVPCWSMRGGHNGKRRGVDASGVQKSSHGSVSHKHLFSAGMFIIALKMTRVNLLAVLDTIDSADLLSRECWFCGFNIPHPTPTSWCGNHLKEYPMLCQTYLQYVSTQA